VEQGPTVRTRGEKGVRERILDAALELFYADGIRGTSADRIIERVGITKVTFYRHFRTKDDLVVAYLEQLASMECAAIEGILAAGGSGLPGVAGLIGTQSCLPGFRGCPFINAAAEFPAADHPVRRVVAGHREWMTGMFSGLAAAAGVADPAVVGGQLMMLRDGAMVAGYLGDAGPVGDELAAAFEAVTAAGKK
jgi:AcrR family transcriptional regulator